MSISISATTDDAERRSVNITLATGDVGTHIVATATELDEIIRGLAEVRSAMNPPFPPDAPQGAVPMTENYRWWVGTMKLRDRRQVAFRHPHLGWLCFLMPDEDAKALAVWLTKPLVDDAQAGKA